MKEERLLCVLGVPDMPGLRVFASDVLRAEEDGGEGSGNFGHKGRPGKVGGSGGGGGKTSGGGSGRSVRSSPAKPAPHRQTTAEEFVPTLNAAKETCPPETAWRVDTWRSAEDFDAEGVKVYITDGGSTFAIKPDGDIISVCKNKETDKDLNARDLMAAAVERGGTHLDSYSGNVGFYAKCGFEVVSRCRFDERYAPPGWEKGRDKPEDIYFMKYVGVGKVREYTPEEVEKRVPYSADYDAAAKVLEDELRGEK